MSDLIRQEIEAICERTFERKISEWEEAHHALSPEVSSEVLELRRKLALINAKERISTAEAALLLNCSDGHIRNLVKRAKKRQAKKPIPFRDIDGVIIFDRFELLQWAGNKSETD